MSDRDGDDGTEDADDPIPRVRLNVYVDEDVKERYEREVFEKHRFKSPYCGTELERELRFRTDDCRLGELWDNVAGLADEFGKRPRKKNFSEPERGDTSLVQYNVSERIRAKASEYVEESQYGSLGEFIEHVMHEYTLGRSVEERLTEQTERILDAAKTELDDDLSAVERRTKKVAGALEATGDDAFSLDEFEDALREAKGIDATAYTRKEYLPRVLDELGYTWTPEQSDLFVDAETIDTEGRDPREKPYTLMSDADKRLAIKYELWALAEHGRGDQELIEIPDGRQLLDGRPPKTTVEDLYRDLAETPGFDYVTGASRTSPDAGDGLRIRQRVVADARGHGELKRLLGIEDDEERTDGGERETPTDSHNDEPADEPANEPADEPDETVKDDPTEQTTSWVDEVVSDVSHIPFDTFETAEKVDNLLTARIGRAKYADADDLDADGNFYDQSRLDETTDAVTDADLDEVRRELGLPETTAATKDEIEDEADEVFAALEGADRARADGGRRMK